MPLLPRWSLHKVVSARDLTSTPDLKQEARAGRKQTKCCKWQGFVIGISIEILGSGMRDCLRRAQKVAKGLVVGYDTVKGLVQETRFEVAGKIFAKYRKKIAAV